MTFFRVTTLVAASFAIAVLAWADGGALPRTDAPDDAEAYIINPKDGDTVKSPVTVVFGIRGMGVAPAGVDVPNTGHHHIVIDAPTPDRIVVVLAVDTERIEPGGPARSAGPGRGHQG